MAAARADEYGRVTADARTAMQADPASQTTTLRRLRGQLRRIGRRDYFPPLERDAADAAVAALAATVDGVQPGRGVEERQGASS
jgi:hypothetical protein